MPSEQGGAATAEKSPPATRLKIVFGNESGDAMPYLGTGWGRAGKRHIWSNGRESTLEIPAHGMERRCLLSINGWPFLQPEKLVHQRIKVAVNDVELGDLVMTKSQTVTAIIPRRALVGKPSLSIRLVHPNAARPSDFADANSTDTRQLAIAYKSLAIEELDEETIHVSLVIRAAMKLPVSSRHFAMAPALDPRDALDEAAGFLGRFHSLGDDCELGIVQREAKIDPLGLLRFSSTSIADATRGIEEGFADIAREDEFEIVHVAKQPTHDYMGRERRYGLMYHTRRLPKDVDAAALKAQEIKRLRFLARKLMEDVEARDSVMVVKRKRRSFPEEIARLLVAIRRRGRARLLWVMEAPEGVLPGTAERLTDDLVAAYVDRIDLPPMKSVSVDSWIMACRSAHLLLQ